MGQPELVRSCLASLCSETVALSSVVLTGRRERKGVGERGRKKERWKEGGRERGREREREGGKERGREAEGRESK